MRFLVAALAICAVVGLGSRDGVAQQPQNDPKKPTVEPAKPADPREAEVRLVVGQFLAAAKTGNIEEAAKHCLPHLVRNLKDRSKTPRKFEAEIRDVLVLTDSAEVTIRQKYEKPIGEHTEFTMTCKLLLVDKQWKINETKVRATARD